MTARITWDRYEVALLFRAYEQVAEGVDINDEATKLSETLRALAVRRGISIDDTYRNVNGMKMQLANVQYLFTDGNKGLSGASTLIRQMFELYKTNQGEYQAILKEAIRLTSKPLSVEDAFFAYAKDKIGLPPQKLTDYIIKATDYCHLKQPLLGITDVKTVRNIQQKVSEGKLLHFRYGKHAQAIRSVTQLYYNFVKTYHVPKARSSTFSILSDSSQISIVTQKAELSEPSESKDRDCYEEMEKLPEETSSVSSQVREQILLVAASAFPNGIRPASIIDINRLKRVYQAKLGEEIPAEVDLPDLLANAGLKSGEKIYFLTNDQKKSLYDLVIGIIAKGHRVIYYSELLSLHGELFESCHIYGSPLMRTVFKSILPNIICKSENILVDRDANEINEIIRAFGDEVIMTYQQVKGRCPYLTLDVIKAALSRSERFVWSSTETFALADLIELDPSEVSDIIAHILPQIQADGYYSLAQLPIEESCGMNPRISECAVRDVIYNRYMADQYSRHGLIVTPKGERVTSIQLMEIWLKGLDQVTLAEIEDYAYELTKQHSLLGISAACSTMIRIDHDHFVSDASVQFDVDAIDRAIALFVGSRIIPITAITSFTSFPDVPGYSWNLYLVESFLRRFSKRFTIDGGPAQISFVGGICSINRSFENYEDRLAHAVIQDGVALTEDSIGRYLTERKYILRRRGTVRRTLERAKILNEQRGETGVRI